MNRRYVDVSKRVARFDFDDAQVTRQRFVESAQFFVQSRDVEIDRHGVRIEAHGTLHQL
jgi:hypothetical protein